jgi:hypothetical protein
MGSHYKLQSFQLSRFGLLRGALAVSSFSLLSSFSPPAWEVSVRSVLVFFSTFASTLACRRKDLVMTMNVNEKYPHEINMNEHDKISQLTGFFPPNMSLKKIVTKTTTTDARIPIVRFGCFSPFSMISCREA